MVTGLKQLPEPAQTKQFTPGTSGWRLAEIRVVQKVLQQGLVQSTASCLCATLIVVALMVFAVPGIEQHIARTGIKAGDSITVCR